jgi:hypothetical protein
MSKPQTVPVLPAGAFGFLGRRVDRPERLALFFADGSLAATFSPDDTIESLRVALAGRGLSVVEEGVVVR